MTHVSRKARLDVAARLIASVEVPGRPVTGAGWDTVWHQELDRRWAEAERTREWGEPLELPRTARATR